MSARRRLDGARTSSRNREHVRIERLVRPHLASLMHAARAPIPGIATVRVSPPLCPPTHGPPCALLQPLSVLSAHLFVSIFSSSRPHTLPLSRRRYAAFEGASRAMMQRAACAPDLISRRARASLGRFSGLRRCADDAAPRSSSGHQCARSASDGFRLACSDEVEPELCEARRCRRPLTCIDGLIGRRAASASPYRQASDARDTPASLLVRL